MQGLTVRAVNSISTKKRKSVSKMRTPPPHTPYQNSSDLDILDKVWHFLFLQFLAKRGKAKKKKKKRKKRKNVLFPETSKYFMGR